MSPEAKAKRAEYNRKYAQNNKEKIRECHKRWRDKNKEKIKQYRENYWERKAIEN